MKRQTTKEILAESLREVAQNRPVDKITIQEIVDNCDYSPATFYRHFKDKYDLIAWDYVHQSSKIMDKVGIDEYEWKDTLTDGMKYFLKNREYMQNLLKNTSGHDAFIRYLAEANIMHLTKCILKLTGRQELEADLEILVKIYCYGTVMAACDWLMDEIKIEDGHLAELFEKALPETLRDILLY
ncbi:MAG: TetR/AcrR family transcriptional regulator C-terminal domain-containing protein [Lachnospiraceae bacterium]|nr:TetR/AcrR family transcriptional regulator C-terminal domain-containing protein [Lachnospiraceae bacterium]